MPEHHPRELATAVQAVELACRVCRNVQTALRGHVLQKQDKSPVTIADFASQAVICRELRSALPDDPIIAEEDAHALRRPENVPFLERIEAELARVGVAASAEEICRLIDHGNATSAERFWTLDPIDGTKGFLRGEQYAVSLALIVEGRIVVGVLGCPNLPIRPEDRQSPGSLFHAVRGEGSHVRPLSEGPSPSPLGSSPIHVSTTSDPASARLCESVESGHSAHGRSRRIAERLGITAPPLRLDSQAKYAAVARGEADIYLRLPTRKDYREKIWDHAGGVLLVEEAGGRVTDVEGRPLEFTHGAELSANRGVIVTNGALHEGVLQAVRDAP